MTKQQERTTAEAKDRDWTKERERKGRQLKIQTKIMGEPERKKDSGHQTGKELTKQQGRSTVEAKDRELTKEREKERLLKTKTEIMDETERKKD